MTLRTKTLTAVAVLAISAGGYALAQDAATPAPAPQAAGTQQSSEPAATPAPAGQADTGQTPAQAPAAPAEPGSGQSPTGETATAPTQSSEPTSTPAPADQTPMEAPSAPSSAPATAAPAAGAPASDAAAPAAEEAPAAAAPEAPGEPAGDAVQVTEGDEAAVPAETTGTVVAEEGHDDIEGQGEHAEGEAAHAPSHGAPHIEDISYSFEGPFGKYDQFQLQRGLQVYTEVCSACHGLKFVPIRTLHDDGGPGLPEDQVRAYAANLSPILDPESGEERPRLPTDHFAAVTGMGMGPDLSLMAKARAAFHGPQGTGINQFLRGIGGPEYIHAILTSYTGEQVEQAGSVFYRNTAFASGNIAMPPPLSDDLVTFEDGTPATVDQMARDVSAFLMWTAEPKLTARKQVGLVSVLFLIVFTSLLYLTNKRIWAPHKGKLHRKA